jgi:hypothetical protein
LCTGLYGISFKKAGIRLDFFCQKLPIGTPEDAPRVGRDVDRGDLLSGLSSARGGCVEACLDGVASMAYAAGSSTEIMKFVSSEALSFLAWEIM